MQKMVKAGFRGERKRKRW